MRILQVINTFARGGGAEKLLLDLVLEFKKKGNDVEILSIYHPQNVMNDDFIKIIKSKNIKIHFLSSKNLVSISNIIKIYKFFKKNNYDIVHSHLFPSLYLTAIMKFSFPSTKLIYTEHSTDNRRRHILLFKLLDNFIYKKYDKIICITETVQKSLLAHVANISTIIINNAINVNEFHSAIPIIKKELIPIYNDSIKLVLMNARFVVAKDHITLFKAIKLLPNYVHLLLIGKGDLENDYKKYCKENNIDDRVHFLGLRTDVANILQSVDLNVLSSNHEGFSISMLESMATGKPFIASSVPGIVDLISDYALLYPHKDQHRLAEIISNVLNDNALAITTGERCFNFAKNYDINNCAENHLDTYFDVLNLRTKY